MSTVRIPAVLRGATGNQKQIEADGETVGAVLETVVAEYPGLRDQLLTPEGQLNRFVNVYVNNEDIRYLQELSTPVAPRDTIILQPAMAGGSEAA
jgi:molybdopterin converting factor small subunit